ncbi:RNA polymerase sigma factor [Pinibacter aurantiacus]|uniref:RNA polymerase sigma factor n=1 Tax=Pinibacter aurantiacus TaxID=2851599 RepID=A0A9E2W4W9_9BACT|nr:RNA polymerase sigma factor [Pinibacter aurantiacus]MBV4357993.1 RNA polymerase sigma factor [Pinibacter aurantiacus]
MEEILLIQGLQQKEEKSFEELVNNYKNKLYNTVLGLVQNEMDAEDITQEVFIQAYESIQSFKGDSKLSTWLYRIAISKALDFIRKKNRKKRSAVIFRFLDSEKKEAEEPATFHHPGVVLEQRENAAMLFKAINELPEKQRIAFTLHKLEALSYQQIAAVLDTSLSSVESLMHRAKTNLRDSLSEYYTNMISEK